MLSVHVVQVKRICTLDGSENSMFMSAQSNTGDLGLDNNSSSEKSVLR